LSLAAKNDFESDVSLILTMVKATNYQIGAYSGILELASSMQYDYVEGFLMDTISEEKQTILVLTELMSEYIKAAETVG
jgi:ferritin-like metal-binding protein YciE